MIRSLNTNDLTINCSIDDDCDYMAILSKEALSDQLCRRYHFVIDDDSFGESIAWDASDIAKDVSTIVSNLDITAIAIYSKWREGDRDKESFIVAFFGGSFGAVTNEGYKMVPLKTKNYLGKIIFNDNHYYCYYGDRPSYRGYMCRIAHENEKAIVVFTEKSGLYYMRDRIKRLA